MKYRSYSLPSNSFVRTLLLCCAFLLPFAHVHANVLSQLDRPGGLVVLSGKDSVAQAIDIATSGRWLAHIVVADEKAEERAREKTQRMAAIVSVSLMGKKAPFSTDTVNATVLSAGADFGIDEARRITAPGGTVLFQGTKETIPANLGYGDWSHWRANADATGIVEDEFVGPSNRLGWMNQGMFASNMRTIEGVVASDYDVWGKTAETLDQSRMSRKKQRLIGRDVFSGVRLWQHGHLPGNTWLLRETFAAHSSGFVHLPTERGKPMLRTDPFSGEITMVYDQGLLVGETIKIKKKFRERNQSTGSIVIYGDVLVQALNQEIALLHVVTGERLHYFKVKDYVARAAVSGDRKTLFVQESPEENRAFGARWSAAQTTAISAYDLEKGTLRWRHTFEKQLSPDFAKRRYKVKHPQYPLLTALVEVDDTLYAYDQEANLGGDGAGDLYAFEPRSGKLVFHHPGVNFISMDPPKGGSYSNNMVVWNGELYHKMAKLPRTKAEPLDWDAVSFMMGNMRCVRLSGSTNYLFNGFNSYMHRDGTMSMAGLFRGNCGMPNYAAYGAMLSAGDQTCGCYNGIRSHGAFLTAERAPFTIVEESQRLRHPPTPTFEAHQPIPSETLAEDMFQIHQLRYVWQQRKHTLEDEGLTLDIDIQRQAIVARGAHNWKYRSDARVYYEPTISRDTVYVSSTAGTVTALDKKTGRIRWRFLAAPGYEKALVNGQIESRWPAVNTLLKDDLLYVAAGRHSELDGGIWFWALNPKSGEIAQRCRIYLPMTVFHRDDPAVQRPKSPHRFRGNQPVARKSLLMSGLALSESGQVGIQRALWNKKGSSSSNAGYWAGIEVDGQRQKGSSATPDPDQPHYVFLPLKLAEWDGRTLDPFEAFDDFKEVMKKSVYNREFIWRNEAKASERER